MYDIYEDTGYRTWHKGSYKPEDAHRIAKELSKDNPHLYKVYTPLNVCVACYRNNRRIK